MANRSRNFGWSISGQRGGRESFGGSFSVSGTESSLNQDRWLIPRRYKLADNPTGTSNGDYLSGASEDFSASELATQDLVLNLRLENFISSGSSNPIGYQVIFAMEQTSLEADLQFGIFKTNPSEGDTTVSSAFTSYATTQPSSTANGIKKISGTISDTIAAGTICSFGFRNPSGTPDIQDIDDLRYWITVYFN